MREVRGSETGFEVRDMESGVSGLIFRDLGFEVWGLGSRASGLGFGAWGCGHGVWGLGPGFGPGV